MFKKKFLTSRDEIKLREELQAAQSIDIIVSIIAKLDGLVPAISPDGFILRDLTPECLKLNIEMIRLGYETIGDKEPQPAKLDDYLKKRIETLEKLLPNFGGIRENVRRLLSNDETYKNAMKRIARKMETMARKK